MKTLTICAFFLLAIVAFAEQNKFQAQLQSLLLMQAKVSDAVDAGLQVLQDLKDANTQGQEAADALNKTQEADYGRYIGDLRHIADQNKAVGDSATANRKHIQSEIQITQEYLAWIVKRKDDIGKQKQQFRDQRCYASLSFVKALREHDEALKVIAWLREDVMGIVKGNSQIELENLNSATSKLGAYAHLFNDEAIKEFNQLTQGVYEEGHGAQQVDETSLQVDQNSVDNTKGKLEINRMGAGTKERDIGAKVLAAIDKLEQHLKDSMADLKKNEVQAAWDLVRWLQATEAEIRHLDEEYGVKTTYIDKLLIAIEGAKAREDEAWGIYFESAAAYNDMVAQLETKRAFYAQEKQRRQEENDVLDEIIKIYKEQVGIIDSGMRNKVNDFSVDKVFDNSDIKRSTDDIGARDGGKYLQNTAAEAEKYRM